MRLDEYCRAVGRDCRLTTTDRVVMWTMSSYVNRVSGETFVSLATIATDVCLHRDQIRKAVRRLEDYGVITAIPRVGRSTVYRFPLHPALNALTPRASTRGHPSTTPREFTEGGSPQPRVKLVHTPRESAENPACPHAPNHKKNHKEEPRDVTPERDTARRAFASVEEMLSLTRAVGGAR